MKGKLLDPETVAKIFRLAATGYGPGYISSHMDLHISTVRRHIELGLEALVMSSPSFQGHSEDLVCALRHLVLACRSEVTKAALAHFRQAFPEYEHVEIIDEEILSKMELMAACRGFRFYSGCPICQVIYRREKASPAIDGRSRLRGWQQSKNEP